MTVAFVLARNSSRAILHVNTCEYSGSWRQTGESCGFRVAGCGRNKKSAGKEGPLVHKANGIAERILGVKTSLAPRSGHDLPFNLETSKSRCPLKESVDIRHGEIDMIRIGPRIEVVSVASRIKARQDHAATIKIVPSFADPPAGFLQQRAIKRRGGFDVGDRENDSENSGHREVL